MVICNRCLVTDGSGASIMSNPVALGALKNPRPDAPEGPDFVAPSYKGAADGKITGVDTTMEYSTDKYFSYLNPVTGTEITGLTAGTYYVRVAETDTTWAGYSTTISLPDGVTYVTEIAINANSAYKTEYTVGDALDLTGLEIMVYRNDTTVTPVAVTEAMISGFDSTVLGTQTLTITYEGVSTTYDVTVSAANNDYWLLLMMYNRKYEVSAAATEGGTITPAGVTKVKYSKDITYTITPADGYMIADVLVDGESVGAVDAYTFKRVKKDHVITAIFVEIPWQNPYSDVTAEDWFYDDVKYVTENGLMNGTVENELFAPELTTTRAMLVTILWRLEGKPITDTAVDFFDVPANEWYTAAVKWASANGIVLGWNGEFNPENPITREQAAAILHRYAVYKGWDSGAVSPMIPQYTCSVWAENDVIWADMNGLLDGMGSDMRDMTAEASRAEVAAMLRRLEGVK